MLRFLKVSSVVATGVLCVAVGVGQARAMDSCAGKYSAALLSPLTDPTVVALDLRASFDINAPLAQAFTNGMREAGLAVSGTPTVKLTLSYQVIGQGGGSGTGDGGLNQGGGGQTGWTSWTGGAAGALQGGQTLALPDIPSYDAFSPQQPVQSAFWSCGSRHTMRRTTRSPGSPRYNAPCRAPTTRRWPINLGI